MAGILKQEMYDTIPKVKYNNLKKNFVIKYHYGDKLNTVRNFARASIRAFIIF